jgi:predicted dehydrogenase
MRAPLFAACNRYAHNTVTSVSSVLQKRQATTESFIAAMLSTCSAPSSAALSIIADVPMPNNLTTHLRSISGATSLHARGIDCSYRSDCHHRAACSPCCTNNLIRNAAWHQCEVDLSIVCSTPRRNELSNELPACRFIVVIWYQLIRSLKSHLQRARLRERGFAARRRHFACMIRVGLIGFGYVGKVFHAPLITSVDGLKLTVIATSDASKCVRLYPTVKVITDYEAAVVSDEVDLVVIATPNETHYNLAARSLHAGKHVVIDKPFTVDLEDAKKLCQLARDNKLTLSVFHNRRWDGDFLTLQRVMSSGQLGDVREVVSRFDRYIAVVDEADLRKQRVPGKGLSVWYDLGPHLLDQVVRLFGMPATIYADLASLREHPIDYAVAILGWERPCARRATLHVSRMCAANEPRFEAHGTAGSFVSSHLDIQEEQLKV